jgi:hypothetical protein
MTVLEDARIRVYHHPNQEIRSFLTAVDLFSPRVERFKNPLDQAAEEILKGSGTLEWRIVTEIMIIPGVEEIHTKPKEIRIKKNRSYSWQDIEPRVIQVLKQALRRKQIKAVAPWHRRPTGGVKKGG